MYEYYKASYVRRKSHEGASARASKRAVRSVPRLFLVEEGEKHTEINATAREYRKKTKDLF